MMHQKINMPNDFSVYLETYKRNWYPTSSLSLRYKYNTSAKKNYCKHQHNNYHSILIVNTLIPLHATQKDEKSKETKSPIV